MAHKITLTIEAHDPNERDQILDELAALLNDHMATTRSFKVSYEEQTMRGKKTITETLEFTPGETVEITEFGMVVERPLEALLRTESTEVRAEEPPRPARRPRASARVWRDDEYQVREETDTTSRLTNQGR